MRNGSGVKRAASSSRRELMRSARYADGLFPGAVDYRNGANYV